MIKKKQEVMNMTKSINILDKDYVQWIKDLSGRYRQSRLNGQKST